MAQNKKVRPAHDCLIKPEHIHEAQKAMVQHGPMDLLARTGRMEPELADFIAAAAKDITAVAYHDSEMPRPVAQVLKERIIALSVSVFSSQRLAVYELYKDFMEGTPAAALEQPPEPSSIPSVPPAEEGDADVKARG